MKYKELKLKYPEKSFGEINVKCNYEKVDACKKEYYSNILPCNHTKYEDCDFKDIGYEIYLHHSCGEWEIGTVDDAQQFKNNLEEAIKYCEGLK